jgi:Ribbon-helix-helix protein, copG family
METAICDERVPLFVYVPKSLIERIDRLAARELTSRSAWARRELLLAVRASGIDEQRVSA